MALLTVLLLVTPVAVHRALFQRQLKARIVQVSHTMVRVGLVTLGLSVVSMFALILALVVGTTAAVVGALIGARLTAMVDPDSLRKAFGWFVLLMSSVILAEEIHLGVGIAAAVITVVAAAVTYVCHRYDHCPLHRLIRPSTSGRAAA